MSMIRCEECDHIFNSDDDPECFEYDNVALIVCESCREELEAQLERENH